MSLKAQWEVGNAVSGSQLFLDFLDFPKLYLRNDDLHVEGSAALGFCVDLTLVGSTILSDKQSFKFLQSPKNPRIRLELDP